MVAVGLWGAFLGPPAIVILPVVFPLVMAAGGVLGILGVPLPGVEIGIAVSAVLLGMMVALAAQPPLWVAASGRDLCDLPRPCPWRGIAARRRCAGLFAPASSIATGCLHLAGIAFGLLARWPAGRIAVRTAGGAIALAGV